jgi:hypothetical protein
VAVVVVEVLLTASLVEPVAVEAVMVVRAEAELLIKVLQVAQVNQVVIM